MATVETPRQTAPLPRAERREAILRAAAVAFARTGYAATSMEDIAGESGVTKLIVYRHFDSKEELYRAVLQRVFDRLAHEFVASYQVGPEAGGIGARALLLTARADPAAFRLLWRHAAREPQFAAYADELRGHAFDASRALLQGVVDERLREWAAHTTVDYLVEAVLNWIEYGDEARDDEFVTLASRALVLGVEYWSNAT